MTRYFVLEEVSHIFQQFDIHIRGASRLEIKVTNSSEHLAVLIQERDAAIGLNDMLFGMIRQPDVTRRFMSREHCAGISNEDAIGRHDRNVLTSQHFRMLAVVKDHASKRVSVESIQGGKAVIGKRVKVGDGTSSSLCGKDVFQLVECALGGYMHSDG